MKAIQIYQYGDADQMVYEEAPKPTPAAGEVQIQVHAAGVNPVDWKTRAGGGIAGMLGDTFPFINGWDVSGVVSASGAGVTGWSVGDEVYGMVNFPQPAGAYAEYVVTSADQVARKPKSLSHTEAAAVPLVTLTAWQALFDEAGLSTGQSILIHAAAGGVGHMAVQLAKWKGAHVAGTASGYNDAFLRSLGVETFINYREAQFQEVLADKPVDVVLDTLSGDVQKNSFSVLKPGGYLVSIVSDPGDLATDADVQTGRIMVHHSADQLTQIAQLIDEGVLSPTISQVFPLAEAAKAHKLGEEGHVRGKLVLTVI